MRDLAKDPLSAQELDALIGERDYREFLNPKNELYRERKMKDRGGQMVVGYHEPELLKIAS